MNRNGKKSESLLVSIPCEFHVNLKWTVLWKWKWKYRFYFAIPKYTHTPQQHSHLSESTTMNPKSDNYIISCKRFWDIMANFWTNEMWRHIKIIGKWCYHAVNQLWPLPNCPFALNVMVRLTECYQCNYLTQNMCFRRLILTAVHVINQSKYLSE